MIVWLYQWWPYKHSGQLLGGVCWVAALHLQNHGKERTELTAHGYAHNYTHRETHTPQFYHCFTCRRAFKTL